jgi:CBS domain-containing protein
MTTAYAQRPHEAASVASVPVAEAMHVGVVTCRADASLSAIARTMAAHRIHAVVVVPEKETDDWSLISDLDLAAAVSEGLIEVATAAEIASTPNLFVTLDETVARAAQLMREYDTHHLIVLAPGAERPVGVVSTLDIADVVAELPLGDTPRTGADVR